MKLRHTIVLGIPTWGRVTARWAEARSSLGFPLGTNLSVRSDDDASKSIAEKRNDIVRHGLENDADWFCFLADDVLPAPNAFMQLMSHGKPIMTGIYWSKGYPKEPYIWRGVQRGPYLKWRAGEVFQVDHAGCDCLVVHGDVFRQIPEPWFSQNWTWHEGQIPGPLTTEDFYFFTKARAHGYEVWCDSGVQCGHEDRDTNIVFTLTEDMPQWREGVKAADIEKTDKVCADIGAGVFSEHYDGTIVRFDSDEKTKPDVRCDARQIPEADESFDEVRCSHVIEHFPAHIAPEIVGEMVRICKKGGRIRIRVPNLRWAIDQVAKHDDEPGSVDRNDLAYAWGVLYGSWLPQDRENPLMAHKTGFTPRKLTKLLEVTAGLEDVEVEELSDGAELLATAARVELPESVKTVQLDDWFDVAENLGTGSPREEEPRFVPTNGAVASLVEEEPDPAADFEDSEDEQYLKIRKEGDIVTASVGPKDDTEKESTDGK